MALAVLTLSSAAITAALSRLRTTASRVIVAGTIGLSLVLTQVQPLATALHLEPLHADDWANRRDRKPVRGYPAPAVSITCGRCGTTAWGGTC
jgi:hypothetical protein